MQLHEGLDELGRKPGRERGEEHGILDQMGEGKEEFPRHGWVSFTGEHSFVKPADPLYTPVLDRDGSTP
ncbi:MAG: hypothetical protein Kow009_02910 [Spirochaetales bacterium]